MSAEVCFQIKPNIHVSHSEVSQARISEIDNIYLSIIIIIICISEALLLIIRMNITVVSSLFQLHAGYFHIFFYVQVTFKYSWKYIL